jgi:choline dehydrogenase-like flavoprotein
MDRGLCAAVCRQPAGNPSPFLGVVTVLHDARQVTPGALLRAEVCVIGSGAGGTTTALELAAAGHQVILLEAGGLRRESSAQETFKGEVVASSEGARGFGPESLHPPLDTVRQRRLGGTTGAWGGRCIPLDAIDFEERDYLAESGWPITREELEPYYQRAAAYCEIGASDFSSPSAIPSSPRFLLPRGTNARFTDDKLFRYSRPTDFGKVFRERMKRTRSLRVMYHANVLRLEVGPDDGLVSGALVASAPAREFRVEARFFVICGGGLETTRLLLVSTRQPGARIDTMLPALGHYYMTHLDGFVGEVKFVGTVPEPAYRYDLSHDGVYCRRLLSVTDDVKRAEGLLNLGSVFYMPAPEDPVHQDGLLSAFALTKQALFRLRVGFKSRRYGLLQPERFPTGAHLRNVIRDPGPIPSFAIRWVRERSLASRKVPSFLAPSRLGRYRFLFSAEQSPSYSNRIDLSSARDRFGMPRLRVEWNVPVADYVSIQRSLSILAADLAGLGFASTRIPGTAEELAAEMGGGFLGGTHAMGSARMHDSPSRGVVDSQCRVHGIENLYIASSAVFPTGGFATPTLTIVALAIRVSDTLRADLAAR